MTKGSKRFTYLKRASRRTVSEQNLIEEVCEANEKFFHLEIIKETMFSFFNEPTEEKGKEVLDAATYLAWQTDFAVIRNWFARTQDDWDTLKNYFKFRVTTAVSEGINNVIKTLKRAAFGYRNPDYFRYKIMQRCGYLNSDYIGSSC